MATYKIERGRRPGLPIGRISLIAVVLLLLLSARSIASYAVDIAWWRELGQFRTWLSMLYYGFAPVAIATLLAFGVLWLAHARAVKFAGTGLREHRIYFWISTLALFMLAYLIAASAIDTWTVVRFAGSRGLPASATAWHDAVFLKPLSFYLFDLPFYLMLRSYVLALVIFCILVYWVAARAWQLRYRFPDMREAREIDPGLFQAGRRARIEVPARGGGGSAAGAGGALLSRPLRNGLQRARLIPGGHRLGGSEGRAAAAVADDSRVPGGRGIRLGGPLAAGRLHGDRRWWWRSSLRRRWPRSMCGPTRSRSSGRTSIPTFTPR